MTKAKKLKIKLLCAIFGIVLCLGLSLIIPISASFYSSAIVVHLNPGAFKGVYYQLDSTEGTWSGPYTESNNIIVTSTAEYAIYFKILPLDGDTTHTGYFLTLLDENDNNITGQVTGKVPNGNGMYYFTFNEIWSITYQISGTVKLYADIINIDEYDNVHFGYSAGYTTGYREGSEWCYNYYYLPVKNQLDALLAEMPDYEAALEQAKADALANAVPVTDIVVDTLATTMDKTGNIFGDILRIKLIGDLSLGMVLLVPVLIPLIIFIIKLFVHA